MIQKLPKIIAPIIISFIGVYLANNFNIFTYVSFVPNDKAFDICIATYFTLLEIIGVFSMEAISSKFMSKISVIISLNNTEVSMDSTPIINFNDDGLAEATITVQIIGRKKHFLKSILMISNVNFATMQANSHDREALVDTEGNYIIDLEKMFGTTDMKTTMTYKFRVSFAKELADNERTIEISPELKKSNMFHPMISYKHNKAQLKIGR